MIEKAKQILEKNIQKLHQLAQYLYEHETITGEEFMAILHAPLPAITDQKQEAAAESNNTEE